MGLRACDRARGVGSAGFCAGRLRPAWGRLYEFPGARGRSRAVRGALRARLALPRLGLLLSRDRKCQRGLLAQIGGGPVADRGKLMTNWPHRGSKFTRRWGREALCVSERYSHSEASMIRSLTFCAALALLSGAALAHHGWGSYDAAHPVTVDGPIL